jgi:heptosyltransferase-2
MPASPRILLVRFSSIGDLLLVTPLLRALRNRHPDAHLSFVVREDMADTLRNNPRLDELITWRRGTPLQDLARRLRAGSWTHRVDLHGSIRSRLLRTMVGGRWTGYPKHRVRRKLLIMSHGRRGGHLGHVADRYFIAARDLDVRPDGGPPEFLVRPEANAEAGRFLAEHDIGRDRPLIAVAPGAAHFTKRWPPYHWITLMQRMTERHDVVVLGGNAERELAAEMVLAGGTHAASAAGRYSLDGTAALLRRASRLIAGDTGVLHLATAVGTPVVGMYGPTVEAFGFFPYHASAVTLQHDLDCRPCTSQGGPRCPLGHHNCLKLMLPAEVMRAVEE